MNFIFIHGWGMDNRVWDGLSTYFPEKNLYFIDLGFINGQKTLETPKKNQKNIYITHSLGGLWALKHKKHDIDGLIVINGFTKFTDFVDKRTLLTMQKRLKRNPIALMNKFWDNIDIPDYMRNQKLNIDELHGGLSHLINWDINKELEDITAPILWLHGEKDPLLSNDNVKKHLSGANIKTHEYGGHVLPLTHPEWCAMHIKEFISEFRLEE